MASHNNTCTSPDVSSVASFHFEDTSFFNRQNKVIHGISSNKIKINFDTTSISRMAQTDNFDCAIIKDSRGLPHSLERSLSKYSSYSTPTLPSIATTGDSGKRFISTESSFLKGSDSEESSCKSSGYVTSSESPKPNHGSGKYEGNLMMTRKLSKTTNCHSISLLSSASFNPIADSTHLCAEGQTFRTRDEYLFYEPNFFEIQISVNSKRRIDRLKITRSPSETIKVVMKIRSITPEASDVVQIELLDKKEIIPANFKGVSSLALLLTATSVGTATIQMVICSICGFYSSKFTIMVTVIE